MSFEDQVKSNLNNCDFTNVKRMNKTLKSVRIDNDLMRAIKESNLSFAEAVNEALREKFKK